MEIDRPGVRWGGKIASETVVLIAAIFVGVRKKMKIKRSGWADFDGGMGREVHAKPQILITPRTSSICHSIAIGNEHIMLCAFY